MLAIQPPRMGPTRPPNANGARLPFGYESMVPFNHDPLSSSGYQLQDFFHDPAPAPAPGEPLLTPAEQDTISNTLANIATASDSYGDHHFGEGCPTGEEWLDMSIPPNVMGLSTTYGVAQTLDDLQSNSFYQHPTSQTFASTNPPPHAFPMSCTAPGTFATPAALMPTASPVTTTGPSYVTPGAMVHVSPTHQHHDEQQMCEPDVLEAAALLQNGSHHRSHSMQGEPNFSNGPQHRPNNSMGPPVGHLRHQPLSEFKQEGRRLSQSADELNQQNTWGVMLFGEGRNRPGPRTNQTSAPVVDLQYGTDHQFNNNHPFVPQNEKDSSESMQKDHLRYLNAVDFSNSNYTTRVPSPAVDGDALNLKTRGPPKGLKIEADGHDGRRFRKSRSGEDDLLDDDEPQSAVFKNSGRKRKSKAGDSAGSPGADGAGPGPGKRRKSSAAVRRDNLTEAQKRENHINSEKKRRKVIQVGFENLGVIIPALNSGANTSKSVMLESAVAFLQELHDGNELLKAQLAQMS